MHSASRNDYGAGALTGFCIRQAHNRNFRDIRMDAQNVFHFLGRDILAIANDDVLESAVEITR
jgi:Ser-tRNA(Ala) deacylase AlaX